MANKPNEDDGPAALQPAWANEIILLFDGPSQNKAGAEVTGPHCIGRPREGPPYIPRRQVWCSVPLAPKQVEAGLGAMALGSRSWLNKNGRKSAVRLSDIRLVWFGCSFKRAI